MLTPEVFKIFVTRGPTSDQGGVAETTTFAFTAFSTIVSALTAAGSFGNFLVNLAAKMHLFGWA